MYSHASKAYAEPMQTKDSETVGSTFLSIMMELKQQPRVLLTDNDKAYQGSFFQKVLDDQEIVLNMNTVGDHHALGIIDNFAKRIKLIFKNVYSQEKH